MCIVVNYLYSDIAIKSLTNLFKIFDLVFFTLISNYSVQAYVDEDYQDDITKAPFFLCTHKLTPLPQSALAELAGKPVGAEQEEYAYHRLEEADRSRQRELQALDASPVDVGGNHVRPVHNQVVLQCERSYQWYCKQGGNFW